MEQVKKARDLYAGIKFKNYADLISQLRKHLNKIPNLKAKNNTIIKHLDQYDARQLSRFIIDHSHFTDRAIHYLLEGQIRTHSWANFQKEIKENIEEELGSKTNGVPHLVIKRAGYLEELEISPHAVVGGATRSFLFNLDQTFRQGDVAALAGALVAFEGTAISEFDIMSRIIEDYAAKSGRPPLDELSITSSYINGHKMFEIEHEQDLIDAASTYVVATNYKSFAKGYLSVCLDMSKWWEDMAIEGIKV